MTGTGVFLPLRMLVIGTVWYVPRNVNSMTPGIVV